MFNARSLESMRKSFNEYGAITGLDPSAARKWSYCFADSRRSRLETASRALKKMGYVQAEEIYRVEHPHVLQVVKSEVHSPTSLARRNRNLRRFATRRDVTSYWGCEVSYSSAGVVH